MVNTLSVIVLTHNDESKIVDCLESVKFADEIIVIDDNSSDRTVELARLNATQVIVRSMNRNFANQRNIGLNLAHGQWILFIDSDELVSVKLKEQLHKAIQNKDIDGYYLGRYDYIWGKRIMHGEVGETRLLRLGRRDRGKWHGKVHEVWEINGNKGTLDAPLLHVPHQTVKEFVGDIDNYSTLRAEELSGQGQKTSFLAIFIYPTAKFIQNYFVRAGRQDGIHGFLYAVMMSFHSFLVRAKLYQLQKHE